MRLQALCVVTDPHCVYVSVCSTVYGVPTHSVSPWPPAQMSSDGWKKQPVRSTSTALTVLFWYPRLTSEPWSWWRRPPQWCGAAPSRCRWSCRCRRNRYRWSRPCPQCGAPSYRGLISHWSDLIFKKKKTRGGEVLSRHTTQSCKGAQSPCRSSSSNRPLHSSLNRLAPVRLPSPPITHRLVMPRWTRLCAALRRPSRVRNSLQRALPMTVPPWGKHKRPPHQLALVLLF